MCLGVYKRRDEKRKKKIYIYIYIFINISYSFYLFPLNKDTISLKNKCCLWEKFLQGNGVILFISINIPK